MARKKNTSFVGIEVPDGDSGAATFTRLVENVAGNAALTFDVLTGEHGEDMAGTTINHSGSGRGCPLRMPIVEQYVGRSLKLDTPPAAGSHGGLNTYYILAVPIFISPGITAVDVIVRGAFIFNDITNAQAKCTITDTSKSEIDSESMDALAGEIGQARLYVARMEGLTSGLKLLFVEMTIDSDVANADLGVLHSWSVYPYTPGRSGGFSEGLAYNRDVVSVRAPTSTQGVNVRDYDEALFYDEAAYHAYLTQGLNVDLNGLYEYATGWPAGGSGTYQLVDHDSGGSPDAVNPARSRFFAHTRSLYSAEPEIAMPIVCAALGAFGTTGLFAVDPSGAGVSDPTVGMLDWYAPYISNTGTNTIWETPVIWPDFQTSSSRLKAAVLLGSNGATTVNNWTMSVRSDVAAAATSLGAPSAIDGTNDLWLATGSALGLWASSMPDVVDTLALRSARGGAKPSTDEMCVLGVCVYFEP